MSLRGTRQSHIGMLALHSRLVLRDCHAIARNDMLENCNDILENLTTYPSANQKTRAAKPGRFVALTPSDFHQAGTAILI